MIVGGIIEREVSACFGIPAEDRLAAWRIGPSDTGIGDNMMTTIAIVATEGFGAIPISGDAFAYFKRFDNQLVTLLTTTRVNGFLSRPQVIHVNVDALDDDAPAQPIARFDQFFITAGPALEVIRIPQAEMETIETILIAAQKIA